MNKFCKILYNQTKADAKTTLPILLVLPLLVLQNRPNRVRKICSKKIKTKKVLEIVGSLSSSVVLGYFPK